MSYIFCEHLVRTRNIWCGHGTVTSCTACLVPCYISNARVKLKPALATRILKQTTCQHWNRSDPRHPQNPALSLDIENPKKISRESDQHGRQRSPGPDKSSTQLAAMILRTSDPCNTCSHSYNDAMELRVRCNILVVMRNNLFLINHSHGLRRLQRLTPIQGQDALDDVPTLESFHASVGDITAAASLAPCAALSVASQA